LTILATSGGEDERHDVVGEYITYYVLINNYVLLAIALVFVSLLVFAFVSVITCSGYKSPSRG